NRGPRRLGERPPGIKRPRVLQITTHPRIRRAGPEPLLSPLPDLIGPHTPRAAGCLQLSYRRRQVPASPLQPAAHRSPPFAATVPPPRKARSPPPRRGGPPQDRCPPPDPAPGPRPAAPPSPPRRR